MDHKYLIVYIDNYSKCVRVVLEWYLANYMTEVNLFIAIKYLKTSQFSFKFMEFFTSILGC